MENILAIGENVSLLHSRALLLAKTGAAANFCTAAELPVYGANASVDLVVLCHTLHDEERCRVLRQVDRRWPHAQILQVFGCVSDESLLSEVDGWVPSLEPGKLIEVAKQLLARSAAQS